MTKTDKQTATLPGMSIHPHGRAIAKMAVTPKSRGSVLRRKIAAVSDHMERTGDHTPSSHLSKLKAKLDALPASQQ